MQPNYAAHVGIDWADRKHDWALAAPGQARAEHGEVKHTPEAVEQFALDLAARFPRQKIAIALEQSRGPLFYMLAKYAHLDLYPVNPATLDHYRQSAFPSGAKSDEQDAALILDLLVKHPERLRAVAPDTDQARLLALLVEGRRAAVDERTRAGNQLIAQLKLYFPQLLEWFEVDQVVLAQMLEKWPTLEQLQRARPATVEQFLRQHGVPEEKRQSIARALTTSLAALHDRAVMESAQGKARHLLAQQQLLRTRIGELERRIEELVAAHPDRAIFASLPGAGPAMLPRLLAAFGTQRERFPSAQQLQCYAGIAPVTRSSGKSKSVHCRFGCPKFLRQTFHEWAWISTRFCPWARAYYDRQRAKNKSHHAAVRALAFKWIRIVFRCWKDGKPYDDSRYTDALPKSGNPVNLLCKSSSGLTQVGQLLA
jgi:transposase